MRLLALAFCGLLFASCSTAHKTYLPPSNAKVAASTKKVDEGASKAQTVARVAKTHVEAAQKHADAISVKSLDVQQKLDAIIKVAPPELQGPLALVKADVTEMQTHETGLHVELDGAYAKQGELDKIQVTLGSDIAQLKTDQGQYESNAQTLATDATNEREFRISAESQLFKQKVFGWLWKIGGGVVVLGVIALVVLWFTGKLAFKFAV